MKWGSSLTECGLVMPYQCISGSTLDHIMASCLIAPSHYLKQCWLTINKVLWLLFQHIGYLNIQGLEPSVLCLKFIHLKSLANLPAADELTHWGRVTHICVRDLSSIGSDNGLSPGRRQAIIRTNAGILLIRTLGTNFSEFVVAILIFSFKKMRLKVSSAKRRPFCLCLNELTCSDLSVASREGGEREVLEP